MVKSHDEMARFVSREVHVDVDVEAEKAEPRFVEQGAAVAGWESRVPCLEARTFFWTRAALQTVQYPLTSETWRVRLST